jgi:predicted RNase H-like HicB family nuclease
MATKLTLEYWQDDGWFVGHLREVPACFSQGETLDELERNIAEVFKLLQGEPTLPIPANAQTKSLLLAA